MTMKATLLTVLLLAGCASSNILLIHPVTGDIAKCSGYGFGLETFIINRVVEACVKNYSAIGFIESDKLTDEQKRSIVPSGKFINQSQPRQTPASASQAESKMSSLCIAAISRRDQAGILAFC